MKFKIKALLLLLCSVSAISSIQCMDRRPDTPAEKERVKQRKLIKPTRVTDEEMRSADKVDRQIRRKKRWRAQRTQSGDMTSMLNPDSKKHRRRRYSVGQQSVDERTLAALRADSKRRKSISGPPPSLTRHKRHLLARKALDRRMKGRMNSSLGAIEEVIAQQPESGSGSGSDDE